MYKKIVGYITFILLLILGLYSIMTIAYTIESLEIKTRLYGIRYIPMLIQ